MSTPDLTAALRRVPLLAGVRDRDLQRMARGLTERRFAAGETIVKQGQPGAGFWLVLEGQASVSIDGQERNPIGPGDWVGEIALIDEGPRSATVTATSDIRAAGMTAWQFKPFVMEHPEVAWTLLQTIAGHLRDAQQPR